MNISPATPDTPSAGRGPRGPSVFIALLALLSIALAAQAADPEEAQYNAAVALYNAGQWQAAVKKIDERMPLNLADEMRAKYLYARGLALEKGGKTDEARSAYSRLIESYPKSPECSQGRIALVYLDYAAGRGEAVIQGYNAIDKNALGAEDKRNLALMAAESFYEKDDFKGALEAYQTAIGLGAEARPIAAKLFHIYLQLQMHAQLLEISAQPIPEIKSDLLAVARAEALLALGRNAEAETEASKVTTDSALAPRAAFARAQALIKTGKLKDAIGPLQNAIKELKNPPAPASACLALAECLIDAGRNAEAEETLSRAEKMSAALSDTEKKAFIRQVNGIRIRALSAGGDVKRLIKTVTECRDAIPAEQRGRVFYMRLFALSEQGEYAALLRDMTNDYPVFQAGPEDGPATLIYFKALRETKRQAEGLALLEALVKRKPAAPEAVKARFELARAAMDKRDDSKAKEWLAAVTTAPGAREALGDELFMDSQYNLAVMAFKLKQSDETLNALNALIAARPATNLLVRALVLSGQACLLKNDYAAAARHWNAALDAQKPEDDPGLREQLACALYAARDFAGATNQFGKIAAQCGSDKGLARESQEAWARALFQAGQFEPAGERFARLYDRFRDMPGYAYEAAVAYERAGKPTNAERWYAVAQKARLELPAEYASVVDAALARLRADAGLGDLGLSYWIEGLAPQTNDMRFVQAVARIRKIVESGKLIPKVDSALEKALRGYTTNQPPYYLLGALRLQCLMDANRIDEAGRLASALAGAFAQNENKMPPQSPGTTLAPAMIYFFKGEAARRAGRAADALADYETVLAAYPYNEWPDAAACGAAECYLQLGDTNTAVAKFNEVVTQPNRAPASATWIEWAKKRLNEINTGGK